MEFDSKTIGGVGDFFYPYKFSQIMFPNPTEKVSMVLVDGRYTDIWKFELHKQGQALTQDEVIQGFLSPSSEIRSVLARGLCDLPGESYFWECRPFESISKSKVTKFEFVVIPAPGLQNVPSESYRFQEHFQTDLDYAIFQNPTRNATFISPVPTKFNQDNAQHLIKYLRHASEPLQEELFRNIGQEVIKLLEEGTVWLSTSGFGVYWLHVRLDRVPKYYKHEPYRLIV